MKSSRWQWAITIVFVITNAMLLIQNYQLRRATPVSGSGQSTQIQVGSNINHVALIDAVGNEVRTALDDAGTKYLALWFTPDCTACADHLVQWRRVVRALTSQTGVRCQIIYLVPEGVAHKRLESYLDSAQVDIGTASVYYVSPRRRFDMRLGMTPTTILALTGGQVDKVWTGTWTDDSMVDVARSLGLPVGAL